MKYISYLNTIFLLSFLFYFNIPTVFANNYGSNDYGECTFSTGCIPTRTPTPKLSVNTEKRESGENVCGDIPPSFAPHLFQIDRQSSHAKLYFAPAGDPYNKYYVVYGYTQNDERFAVSFPLSQAPHVATYTINHLQPNHTYYFKIRAGYGCANGPWSQSVWTRGISGNSKATFYLQNNTVISHGYTTLKNVYTAVTKPKTSVYVAPETTPKISTAKSNTTNHTTESTPQNSTSSGKSVWQKILSWFGW